MLLEGRGLLERRKIKDEELTSHEICPAVTPWEPSDTPVDTEVSVVTIHIFKLMILSVP